MGNKTINDYIGKQLSWEDMQAFFPDKWVVYDDSSTNGTNKGGTLLFVTEKRKIMWEFIFNYFETTGKKLKHNYTTESTEFNGLWQL